MVTGMDGMSGSGCNQLSSDRISGLQVRHLSDSRKRLLLTIILLCKPSLSIFSQNYVFHIASRRNSVILFYLCKEKA